MATFGSTVNVGSDTTIGGNLIVNGAGPSYFSVGSLGIGNSAPTENLTVTGNMAAQVNTNVEGLKLTDTSDVTKAAFKWNSSGIALDIPSASSVNKILN